MNGIDKKSWRSRKVILKAGEPQEVTFQDQEPNLAQIRNYGLQTIYVSTSSNVSETKYQINIAGGGVRVFLYPPHFKSLYFYSLTDCELELNTAITNETYSNELDQTQTSVIINSTTTSSVIVTNEVEVKNDNGNPLSVNVNSIPEVEIKNDLNNPLPVNVTTVVEAEIKNDSGNPIPVSVSSIPEVEVKNDSGNPLTVNVNTIPEVEVKNDSGSPLNVLSSASDLKPATTPTIYNVSLVSANTEYSQALPSNTRRISISIQDGQATDNFRLAFVTGKVATPTSPYLKYPQSTEYHEEDILSSNTIFIASSVAGKVAQIICWN